ncbi:hypothetical protein GA707_11710 [Nostocoides sp. F2B08]|uniref:hypothetical protein n=1 Tax=Nostocoides sp. F2B08 TaxID=2653936 RepID=UPI001262CE5C|nr:hypothetical protein [Tetrasphaera sp. F2B08]KAB7744109.1 hypothetical protein GA707_11710 [Tetrasphaera sp. F2B08]
MDETATTTRHEREQLREGITMALYIGFSLLAVLLATPTDYVDDSRTRVATTVALTALGLVLAHQVAYRLSTRLLNRGVLDAESLAILRAQLLGGLPVVAVAAVPVLLFGGRTGVLVAELLLLAIVASVGYLTARSAGASSRSVLLNVVGVMVVVGAVLALKIAVGH